MRSISTCPGRRSWRSQAPRARSPGRRRPRWPRSAPRAQPRTSRASSTTGSGGGRAPGAEGAAAYFEGVLNDRLASGLGALLDPELAPRLLMLLHGAHLTHLAPRFEGEDILFEYVAPVEPEPKPRPDYAGVIGRQYVDLGIGGVRFTPQSLGDTWAA